MRRSQSVFFCIPFLSAIFFTSADLTTGCKLFLLKESDGAVKIEAVQLKPGESRTFSAGGTDGIIAPVIPLSPGKSGDLIQQDKRSDLTLTCRDGSLQITVRKPDGREQTFPAVKTQDLAGYDIRVNVTAADGAKVAFLIEEYAHVTIDDGPVIDLFGGKIPMHPGDYSITTETSLHKKASRVAGEIPIKIIGDLFIVRGSLGERPEGYFVVDFGAGATVFSKAFLPADTVVKEMSGVEYSGEGKRTVKGIMEGAGGQVNNFLGRAPVKAFRAGTLLFSDISVLVVDHLFTIEDHPISGIIGLDLLRRADIVHFGAQSPTMVFSDKSRAEGKKPAEVLFSMVTDHIFIDGTINGSPVSFIFDTGARASLLSSTSAAMAKLKIDKEAARQFQGLDGNRFETYPATAENVTLGKENFSDVTFHVSDLYVLNVLGLEDGGGILGNDFLKRFGSVEVDFSEEVIRFLP